MPLNIRASNQIQNFNLPVSYRIYEQKDKLIEARNVFSNQNRLETRFGHSRYNAVALDGSVLSMSFFTKSDGSRYAIAKDGTNLKTVAIAGAHTTIKSGLSATTVHRGITDNNRHIIAIEGDGLYSFDGTIFSPLGQAAPATLTAVTSNGGSLTDTTQYQAAVTFYASSIGFESNKQTSSIVGTSSPNLTISLSNIPATATNGFVDKIRIYLKNVTTNSDFLFIKELPIGTTSTTITANSTSAVTPPVNNGAPLAGGGKYLASFNSKTVYAGNASFPNEVYFSEPDLPDAYNPNGDQTVLFVKGQGGVTGIATGFFGDTRLDPFLVIFKRKSTHIYSEIGDSPKFATISSEIGCVSHNTIQVKNGVVYFLSEEGWRAIANGQFIKDQSSKAATLSGGDIDDIFRTSGYIYEVNRAGLAGSFSVYYPTLDQYLTWVSEGTNNAYTKTYSYEMQIGGFKPYEFSVAATCAVLGENASGRDLVLFGTSNGYIMKHSIMEERADVNNANTQVSIDAYAVMPWQPAASDMDATYNFRELLVRAVASSFPMTVKTFLNFDLSQYQDSDYSFTDPNSGFILDESRLDEGVFGDDRTIVTARADINRVGESMAIGFYQNVLFSNMALVSMQIDSSKNGNRNL